jgi:hypothetical protein
MIPSTLVGTSPSSALFPGWQTAASLVCDSHRGHRGTENFASLVPPFGITVTYLTGSSRRSKSLGAETDQKLCQILAGEGPLDGAADFS